MATHAFWIKYPTSRRAGRPARTMAEGIRDAASAEPDSATSKFMNSQLIVEETERSEARKNACLLAELAHDLCSPLSTISVIGHTLREHSAGGEQEEDIEAIVRISEGAIGLVHDVLDQARIEAGLETARRESCDLQRLIEDVVEVHRRRVRDGNVEFNVDSSAAFPRMARTDGPRLQRILTNVLDNAFKYTRRGTVTLSMDARQGGATGKVHLIFEIRDTGVGIAPQDHDRIFERFVRLPGTRGTAGAGLGLAIASQMTGLLGGTITVESEPGKGSCFRIELPVE
jgi:signal transduction histidine kinase